MSEKISQADFEKKVIALAKKGLTSEKIGEALRKEGIHPNDFNKKIVIVLSLEILFLISFVIINFKNVI